MEPALLAQGAQDAGHGDPGGAERTGELLVGEFDVEPQPLLTGLAVVVGEQLEETAHPLLNAPQAQERKQGLGLAVASGHALEQSHGQVGRALDFLTAHAEQIRTHQRCCRIGIHVGEGIAKRFVGARQAKQELVAVDGDRI